jgi:hypothetical protein
MLRYTRCVSWNCASCGKVINTGSYIGQYYCSIRGCFTLTKEIVRKNREWQKNKHRVKSLVKKIEWNSKTKKYKVKDSSFKVGRPYKER